MLTLINHLALDCRNYMGKSVDYFSQIKRNQGLDAFYYDPTYNKLVQVKPMNNAQNPIMLTLQPLYKKSNNYQVMMFNDQDCDEKAAPSTKAHQKGVLAFDEATGTGFYLQHSTPKFPHRPNEELNYTNKKYGQHFFCVNIDKKGLGAIGYMLYVTRPYIYYDNFKASFVNQFKFLNLVHTHKYEKKPKADHSILTSRKGVKLDMFYKNRQWGSDFWIQLIAQKKQDNILVETWLRDSNAEPHCRGYTVQYVKKVKFCGANSCFAWERGDDHSKWGVGLTKKFTCYADINFMESQKKRGGSGLCLSDKGIYQVMRGAIISKDPELSCRV